MSTFVMHQENCNRNFYLENLDCSFAAKSLLNFIFSAPKGWDHTLAGLIELLKIGRDRLMNSLRELKLAGFVNEIQERGSNGRFLPVIYVVFSSPSKNKRFLKEPQTDFQGAVEKAVKVPQTDFQGAVKKAGKSPQTDFQGAVKQAVKSPQTDLQGAVETCVNTGVLGFEEKKNPHADQIHAETLNNIINKNKIKNKNIRPRPNTFINYINSFFPKSQEEIKKNNPENFSGISLPVGERRAMNQKEFDVIADIINKAYITRPMDNQHVRLKYQQELEYANFFEVLKNLQRHVSVCPFPPTVQELKGLIQGRPAKKKADFYCLPKRLKAVFDLELKLYLYKLRIGISETLTKYQYIILARTVKHFYPKSCMMDPEIACFWYGMLKNVDFEKLMRNLLNHVQTSIFCPSIAELLGSKAEQPTAKTTKAVISKNDTYRLTSKTADVLDELYKPEDTITLQDCILPGHVYLNKQNSFNNFPQRNYDMEKLEKFLLNSENKPEDTITCEDCILPGHKEPDKKNSFNNFPQRKYDMEKLEIFLLNS